MNLLLTFFINIVLATHNLKTEYASLEGKPFGYKNPIWITCTSEDQDCSRADRLNSSDAYCVGRVLYDIAVSNDPDYIEALELDDKLDSSYIGKVVARCLTKNDTDTFLKMNLIRDAQT